MEDLEDKQNTLKTYIISYDLKNGSKDDYEELSNTIKGYKIWAHITKSTWAIVTDERAKFVRDKLISVMPVGSSLFIVKSGSIAAWRNVQCSNEWLKKHL